MKFDRKIINLMMDHHIGMFITNKIIESLDPQLQPIFCNDANCAIKYLKIQTNYPSFFAGFNDFFIR